MEFNQLQRDYDALLTAAAVPHAGGLGRERAEQEDAVRLRFQRDRGRIVHTQAFRRLKGKTQVFVGGQGDHYRTRLTHTLEVAGISRDIARALRLNEDLAECIALAHDLGHPPFGHAGESTLNTWMKKQGSGFEHNQQSYRLVTVLEEHSSLYTGLNLNQEILEGLLKHRTPHDEPGEHSLERSPSLEAQIVNIADEIAYTAHDCEDGLEAQVFSQDTLLKTDLAAEADTLRKERGTSLRGAIIHTLVHDLLRTSAPKIVSLDLESVYKSQNVLIEFSPSVRQELDRLRAFLTQNMYEHPDILARTTAGQDLVHALCDSYFTEPDSKILELQNLHDSSKAEAVKDYVAGMTDRYAFVQAHERGVLPQAAYILSEN